MHKKVYTKQKVPSSCIHIIYPSARSKGDKMLHERAEEATFGSQLCNQALFPVLKLTKQQYRKAIHGTERTLGYTGMNIQPVL